ncbi:MAG: SdpI family protein [Patescibacteria group bacterium]|nr:SdpI family protein [Patescibacteria group bacterium]
MNPIKLTIKSEFFSILLIVISIIASFYFYVHFPDRVITHWNLAGEPNGYSGRAFAAFFFPALFVGMYLLFIFLPMLDPRKERYAEFAKIYNVFRNLIIFILVVIYFVASFNNLGANLNINVWVPGAVGLLFIVLGNYMGKIKPNWFVGIRTPWTLSSETVWNKTHRFGGKVFIIGGLLMISAGLAPLSWRLPIFVADIIILLFGTVVYSYFAYLQEKKK